MSAMPRPNPNDPLFRQIRALPPLPERAIIINCGTKTVSTLALLSALRYADMPVLMIDCESRDGSVEWFRTLAEQYRFSFIQAPLRDHGATLDIIFSASQDATVLLIDSDLEILRAELMPRLRTALASPAAYGAGFLHRAELMPTSGHPRIHPGRYMERMWIPICLLKVTAVRAALNAGATFMHSRDYLEFPWSKALSKLFYARLRLPLVKHLLLNPFTNARGRIHGEPAPFREYDTGARVHQALLASGLKLADLGEPDLSQSVRHYHGVTRAALNRDQANATPQSQIQTEVEARLRDVYQTVIG
jgi:glycosyltransferase involved in cell wall biosynthesis